MQETTQKREKKIIEEEISDIFTQLSFPLQETHLSFHLQENLFYATFNLSYLVNPQITILFFPTFNKKSINSFQSVFKEFIVLCLNKQVICHLQKSRILSSSQSIPPLCIFQYFFNVMHIIISLQLSYTKPVLYQFFSGYP